MRKLTIVLAAAGVAASTAGCCGRCKNWFYKGSPCGTAMTPAVLSAPLAMGTPMAAPMMQPTIMQPNLCVDPGTQPVMCVPCDPCDPCGGAGMSGGYFGSYLPGGANCECADGGAMFMPGTVTQGGTIPAYPAPAQ